MSASNVIAVAAAILGAFVGAFVGGWANYLGTVKAETRKRFADREDAVKSEVLAALIEVVFMTTDMQTLEKSIVDARARRRPELECGEKLWQAIYKFDLKPSVTESDHRRFVYIHDLNDRDLMEKLMAFTSAYHSNILRIEQYHQMRDEFEEYMKGKFYFRDGERRFRPAEDDTHQGTLEVRMDNHISFLEADIPKLAQEGIELQKLLFTTAERRFGSADFLRLKKEVSLLKG